jgi:hypothetical protein
MPNSEDQKLRMREKDGRDKNRAQNGGEVTRKKKKKKKKEQQGLVSRGFQVIKTFNAEC